MLVIWWPTSRWPGVAILHSGLWDIDMVINRALVYGFLTAMLGLVYFGGVAMSQVIFEH